jgi:hypothetical protein
MPRRRSAPSSDHQVGNERFTTASGSVSQSNSAESTHAEDERQVRETLAEYFAILLEWSRDSRPNGVSSDSGT